MCEMKENCSTCGETGCQDRPGGAQDRQLTLAKIQQDLEELEVLVMQRLSEKLKSGNASPAFVNLAVKFLKDRLPELKKKQRMEKDAETFSEDCDVDALIY